MSDLATRQRISALFKQWWGKYKQPGHSLATEMAVYDAYRAGYAQAEADAKQGNEPDEGLPYCTCIGCRETQQAEADAASVMQVSDE